MSGRDDGGFNPPTPSRSSGAVSPARSQRSAQIILNDQILRGEQLARRHTHMDVDLVVQMEAFQEVHRVLVRDEHLAEMEQLRIQLSTIDTGVCAQTRLLQRPIFSDGETCVVKTLDQVIDMKVLSAFGRTHAYVPQMSLAKQRDIFLQMIAPTFAGELQ